MKYVEHIVAYKSFDFTLSLNDRLKYLKDSDVQVLDIQYSSCCDPRINVFSALIICYSEELDGEDDWIDEEDDE